MMAHTLQVDPPSEQTQVAAPANVQAANHWEEVDLYDLADLSDDINELLKLNDRGDDLTEKQTKIRSLITLLAVQLGVTKELDQKYKESLKRAGQREVLVPIDWEGNWYVAAKAG